MSAERLLIWTPPIQASGQTVSLTRQLRGLQSLAAPSAKLLQQLSCRLGGGSARRESAV